MALLAGTRLGPYEILEPLGTGGMGEVYGARDSRLGRSVAIKVLPGHLSTDERLRQRFEREARALAALSHPHICTLHDIGHENGVSFLVMERLEGETLVARLTRGPLPPAEAARLGTEIADALHQAHRRGVVHRDLKPANVMLTGGGVKLLDFGLAVAPLDLPGTPAGGPTELTRSQPLTTAGTILGTVPYMAPEQLEGREADARTDIFALGSVLYEMVAGRRAFGGGSPASVIAAILTAEPPRLATIHPHVPAALERAVTRCLAKDPEARWQSARDLQLELAWIADAGSDAEAGAAGSPSSGSRRGERWFWLLAVGALGAALGWALLHSQVPSTPGQAARFAVVPPEGGSFHFARISPDGRHLSFTTSTAGGTSQIWLRPLDSLVARPLAGTEGLSWEARGIPGWRGSPRAGGSSPGSACVPGRRGIPGHLSRTRAVLIGTSLTEPRTRRRIENTP
jgi:serine/threonine protein kinase